MDTAAPNSISNFLETFFFGLFDWGIFKLIVDFFEGIYEIPAVRIVIEFLVSIPGVKQTILAHKFMYGNENFEIYRIVIWLTVSLVIAHFLTYYIKWGYVWLRSIVNEGRSSEQGIPNYWNRFDPRMHKNKPRNILFYILSPFVIIIFRTAQFIRYIFSLRLLFLYIEQFVYMRFVTMFPDDIVSNVVINFSELDARFTNRATLDRLRKDATSQIKAARGDKKQALKRMRREVDNLEDENAELRHIIAMGKRSNKPLGSVLKSMKTTVEGI